MSTNPERIPLDEKDLAATFFEAKLAGDTDTLEKLTALYEAVDEARCNGLIIALFSLGDEIGYSVKKKPKIGFKQD